MKDSEAELSHSINDDFYVHMWCSSYIYPWLLKLSVHQEWT